MCVNNWRNNLGAHQLIGMHCCAANLFNFSRKC
uniref:Uncharacterized protein n=1 Tax=Anguilla anguilla TaxID=7936 RepID=A0A0E9RBL6_ANGAN